MNRDDAHLYVAGLSTGNGGDLMARSDGRRQGKSTASFEELARGVFREDIAKALLADADKLTPRQQDRLRKMLLLWQHPSQ
jgi:hypothetical protein